MSERYTESSFIKFIHLLTSLIESVINPSYFAFWSVCVCVKRVDAWKNKKSQWEFSIEHYFEFSIQTFHKCLRNANTETLYSALTKQQWLFTFVGTLGTFIDRINHVNCNNETQISAFYVHFCVFCPIRIYVCLPV